MNNRRMSPAVGAGIALTMLSLAVTAYGQTATIQGRITDQTGAVVPQARVTATNVGSGVNAVE